MMQGPRCLLETEVRDPGAGLVPGEDPLLLVSHRALLPSQGPAMSLSLVTPKDLGVQFSSDQGALASAVCL